MFKKILVISAVGFLYILSPIVNAQQSSIRVVTCDTTVAPQASFKFKDDSAKDGALVENPSLITLPNGMRAVQFSVRHIKDPDPFKSILKFRYSVQWTDDCGRVISNTNNVIEGLALDPKTEKNLQSVAPSMDATHAYLRTYVEIN